MGWEEKSDNVSYKAFTQPLSFPTSKRVHIRVTNKEVLTSYLEQLSKKIYSCKINRRDYLKISGVTTRKSSILLKIGKKTHRQLITKNNFKNTLNLLFSNLVVHKVNNYF